MLVTNKNVQNDMLDSSETKLIKMSSCGVYTYIIYKDEMYILKNSILLSKVNKETIDELDKYALELDKINDLY